MCQVATPTECVGVTVGSLGVAVSAEEVAIEWVALHPSSSSVGQLLAAVLWDR